MSEINNVNEVDINEEVNEVPRYPLMRRRIKARLIDGLIFFAFSLLVGGGLLVVWPVSDAPQYNLGAFEQLFNIFFRFAIAAIVAWLLSGIYELVMVGKYGATIGKRVMKLQIVDAHTLKPVTMGHSLVRILVYLSSSIVGVILGLIFEPAGALVSIAITPLALWRFDGKSGVDLVAKTLVISTIEDKLASEDKLTGRRVVAVLLAILFVISGFSNIILSKLSSDTFSTVNQSAAKAVAEQSADAVWRDIQAQVAFSGVEINDALIDQTIAEDYSEYKYDANTNALTIVSGENSSVKYICTTGVSDYPCM